jgi:hypothetical protein
VIIKTINQIMKNLVVKIFSSSFSENCFLDKQILLFRGHFDFKRAATIEEISLIMKFAIAALKRNRL